MNCDQIDTKKLLEECYAEKSRLEKYYQDADEENDRRLKAGEGDTDSDSRFFVYQNVERIKSIIGFIENGYSLYKREEL